MPNQDVKVSVPNQGIEVHNCGKELPTCGLAISEGGVGKEGGGNRLQGQPNPGLLNHVLLTLKVNVDLHTSMACKNA